MVTLTLMTLAAHVLASLLKGRKSSCCNPSASVRRDWQGFSDLPKKIPFISEAHANTGTHFGNPQRMAKNAINTLKWSESTKWIVH